MSNNVIEFNGVTYSAGGNSILNGLDFTIGHGEFAAVTGTNGAGKTTAMKMMMGLLKPDTGSVSVLGADTRNVRTSALARNAGYLFQNPDRQLCAATAREELFSSLLLVSDKKTDKNELYARCDDMLDSYSIDGNASPISLSRGMRQKLALAAVMIRKPGLLLLDEPTTGLDYRECCSIMERISALNNDGVTVVMICHDMEIVLDYATRVLALHSGRLVSDMPVGDFFFDSEAMAQSSVTPPQIPELSALLGGEFLGESSVNGMADRLIKHGVA